MTALPEPDRARFVDVNRTRLRLWSWGDVGAPPLLLAHGGHDHGRVWDHFAPRLAALGFHVHAADLRGHGDSGRLGSGHMWSASSLDLCELARLVADEAGTPGEPVGIVGHSMGAGQSITAAGTAPERFAWLVVLDGLGPPSDGWFEPTDPVTEATGSIDRLLRVRARPPRVWSDRAEMAARRGDVNHRVPGWFLEHLVLHGTTETEGGFVWKTDPLMNLGMPDDFSIDMILAGYRDVTAPVLALVATEADSWSDLTMEEMEHRVGCFADGRLRPVQGAGHYVHVEQPDVVLDEIVEFLDEIGARP